MKQQAQELLAQLQAEHPGRDLSALEALLPEPEPEPGPDAWEDAGDAYYFAKALSGRPGGCLRLTVSRKGDPDKPSILDGGEATRLRDMLTNFIEGRRLDGGEL